jgi:hypothetical protein
MDGDGVSEVSCCGDRLPLTFAAEDLDAVDAALTTLEARLAVLVSLRPELRPGWARMGEASERFCRQTLAAIAAQPPPLSAAFDLSRAQADLAAADALHPRLLRLRRLADRAEDSSLSLGADVMMAALQARALLEADGDDRAQLRVDEASSA